MISRLGTRFLILQTKTLKIRLKIFFSLKIGLQQDFWNFFLNCPTVGRCAASLHVCTYYLFSYRSSLLNSLTSPFWASALPFVQCGLGEGTLISVATRDTRLDPPVTQGKACTERLMLFLSFSYCRFRGLLGSRSAPPFHNARRVANGQIFLQNIISFLNPTHETESAAYLCKAHACTTTKLMGLSFPKADFTSGPQITRLITSI